MKTDLQKYLEKVRNLQGTKVKMGNPVTRAIYENHSVETGHWLTLEEFESILNGEN